MTCLHYARLAVLILIISSITHGQRQGPTAYLGCYLRESTPRKENEPIIFSGSTEAGLNQNRSSNQYFHQSDSIKQKTAQAQSSALLDLWYVPKLATASKNPIECSIGCGQDFFRYAGIYKVGTGLKCLCGSSYGIHGMGQCNDCESDKSLHCGSFLSASIYDTGFKVPSKPQQIMLLQRHENSLRISWVQPIATNGPLTAYNITAKTVFSYAPGAVALPPKSWQTSTDSEQEATLTGLIPGSQYSISVTAMNSEGESEPISVTVWTKLGTPDIPATPKVTRRDEKTITIELKSARNTKGPISSYRIALIDTSQSRFLGKDRTTTWKEAVNIGYSYYIAAELSPEEVSPHGRKFTIGDARTYGGFYNGHVPPGHWVPILGITSSMDGFTETSYSSASHTYNDDGTLKEDNVEIIETDPGVLLALWISIGVSALILAICVTGFVVLKLNLLPKRGSQRRRPMTPVQFPIQAIENHQLETRDSTYVYDNDDQNAYTHNIGFVHDEDIKSRCLEKLKQVYYVPRNFVDIPNADDDSVQLFGKGRYGPVYLSTLKTDGTPVTLYTVPESAFQTGAKQKHVVQDDPQQLYAHLDEFVRIGAHVNVVKLIGFMEDGGSMYFVTEFGGIPLKSWLLQCRQFDDTTYTDVTPYSFLLCAMNIAEAMFHLSTYKVSHGQLAACNILVSNIEAPKLTGFGLLSNNMLNEERDYTRWSSAETFQNRCVKPCDMWAFGILLWEIATLGATPYYDIRTEDLAKRIGRGSRPGQTEFMGDPLYQIMLHCWQIDRDERPSFDQLSCSVHELLPHSKDNLFVSPSFNYPPYIHQYEHID